MADVTTSAATVHKAAQAATYGGSAGAMYFGYTANEWAAFGGLAVAVIGLIVSQAVNFWFRWQHLKIARASAHASEDD